MNSSFHEVSFFSLLSGYHVDSGLIHSHIGVAPAHQNFMSSNHLDLKNTSSSLIKYWLTQSFNRKHVSFIFASSWHLGCCLDLLTAGECLRRECAKTRRDTEQMMASILGTSGFS